MIKDVAEALRQRLRGKRVLIFDFDGTIADTSLLHEKSFQETLDPLGIRVDYPSIAGLRTNDALVQCLTKAGLPVSGERINELAVAKQAAVRRLIREQLQPIPGVHEFLSLAKLQYLLALYSSGSRGTVELAMEKLGYGDWFKPMLCSEDVVHAKPHPEGFLKILDILSVTASDALVFEDSDAGINAARYAGIEVHDVRAIPFNKFPLNPDCWS